MENPVQELLPWIVLAAVGALCFYVHALATHLDRTLRLSLELIDGQQRRLAQVLERIERTAQSAPEAPAANVVPFERRRHQRRGTDADERAESERRQSAGRRASDLADAPIAAMDATRPQRRPH